MGEGTEASSGNGETFDMRLYIIKLLQDYATQGQKVIAVIKSEFAHMHSKDIPDCLGEIAKHLTKPSFIRAKIIIAACDAVIQRANVSLALKRQAERMLADAQEEKKRCSKVTFSKGVIDNERQPSSPEQITFNKKLKSVKEYLKPLSEDPDCEMWINKLTSAREDLRSLYQDDIATERSREKCISLLIKIACKAPSLFSEKIIDSFKSSHHRLRLYNACSKGWLNRSQKCQESDVVNYFYEKAIPCIKKEIEIWNELKDGPVYIDIERFTICLANAHLRLGDVYFSQNKNDLAVHHFSLAVGERQTNSFIENFAKISDLHGQIANKAIHLAVMRAIAYDYSIIHHQTVSDFGFVLTENQTQFSGSLTEIIQSKGYTIPTYAQIQLLAQAIKKVVTCEYNESRTYLTLSFASRQPSSSVTRSSVSNDRNPCCTIL